MFAPQALAAELFRGVASGLVVHRDLVSRTLQMSANFPSREMLVELAAVAMRREDKRLALELLPFVVCRRANWPYVRSREGRVACRRCQHPCSRNDDKAPPGQPRYRFSICHRCLMAFVRLAIAADQRA